MRFLKKILIFISLFIFNTFGQKTELIKIETETRQLPFGLSEQVSKDIPKVALALSGGGARGLAQVGILKALVETGIQIDEIVGTSMGSIVGGLYAAGYSVKELDSIANNIDWASLVSLDNKTNRRDLFVDQKITEDKAVLSLRLDGLKPIIPTSINDGQRLSNQLNLLTLQAPIHVEDNFKNMLCGFSAVCTDLTTGEKIVLDKGSLSLAMRASSSVSFLLSPTKYDSLILVDGGLVENIPVSTAIQQGADLVIAVNTTSELHSKDDLQYPWLVADQVVSIPMKLLNEKQLNSANFILQPSMPGITAGDFLLSDSIIAIGYTTAKQKANAIKSAIDSIMQSRYDENNYYLHNIKFVDDDVPEFKNAIQTLTIGMDSISRSDIAQALNEVFKTGTYQNLQAEIQITEEASSIEVTGEKNPEVKSYLIVGMEILDKSDADSILSELLNKPYAVKKVVSALLKILRLYRNRGYSLADVTSISFNKQIGQLQISIDEGKISKIIIDGNERTSETIITREFPVKEGDYFLYKNIEEGLTNLRSTGLFNDVIFSVIKENGENVVSLRVSEKISGVARIGFRSDNENKTQLSLDIRDENLFGSGTEIGALMTLGSRNRSIILEQKSNRLWDTYLTYKVNAYHILDDAFLYNDDPATSENKFTRSAVGEYRQIYYGVSLALGTQVERFGNLILQGKYEVNQIKNKTASVVLPYKIKIVSFKISTTIDTQDKYPYPRYGFLFTGLYETAQKILGGEVGYTNLSFNYKNFLTFGEDHTISPKISLGFGDKTLPFSQQYSLGGQYSFFGMRDEEFRGRQLFLASLEYRYNLPVDLFFDTYVSVRYDLGSMWVEQEAIRFKDLRHGIGATLSLDTPIGPADFAAGRSFLFKKNLPGNPISWGEVFFYFSIGYYF